MVVQHNMSAMNCNRMLNVVSDNLSKVTEKLSSGYKINRSADDAAGLAISEKMRMQIRGLSQASRNAQDGISLIQVADGALNEVHDMLQRMNELSVQAANGINTDADREAIQSEIDQLISEIDRIGSDTQFNTMNIFGGGNGSSHISDGGNGSSQISGGGNTFSPYDISAIQSAVSDLNGTITGQGTGTITMEMDSNISEGKSVTIAGNTYTIGPSTSRDVYTSSAVNGTDYSVSTVSSGGATAASMATGSPNANNVSMNAKFYNEPTSDAEKTAQNNFLSAIKNGAFTSTAADNGGMNWCALEGNLTQDGYSATVQDIFLESRFPYTVYITKGGTKVGEINFILNSSLTQIDSLQKKIYGGTITQATYAPATQKDVLTANSDLYTSDGTLVLASGSTMDVGSMDLSTLKLKTTIPAMADADGDGIDDNDPSVISEEKAYELIENELPAGFTKSVTGSRVTYTFAEGNTQSEAPSSGGQGGQEEGNLRLSLQVGATAFQKIDLEFEKMNATVIGIKDVDVTSESSAGAAIDSVQSAIDTVSSMRSKYGAYQNRLEHTIRNLDNTVENTTKAESTIRDTDMAQAMVEFSKYQILHQVGQTMLAQANQSKSAVLTLLS